MLVISAAAWLHFIGVAVLVFSTCETNLSASGIAIPATLALISTVMMHRYTTTAEKRNERSLAVLEIIISLITIACNLLYVIDYAIAIGRCVEGECLNTDAFLFVVNSCVSDIRMALLMTVAGVFVTLTMTEIAFFIACISIGKDHKK
jgi:hypothetical protein